MSKKDVAKSKPAKGKDKAKEESGVKPDLNVIREKVAEAKAERASIVEALNEGHAAVDKVVGMIDVLVQSTEGSVEFAGFVQRIKNIEREVEAGREAIAAAEQKETAFEHLTETAMHLRDQYGSEETTKLVTDLLGRLVGDAYVDGPTCGGTFKVPTLPSEAHPFDDEASGCWSGGAG